MSGLATISVSREHLHDLLVLPPWLKIRDASISDDGRTVIISVDGQFCEQDAVLVPVYERNRDGSIRLVEMRGANT